MTARLAPPVAAPAAVGVGAADDHHPRPAPASRPQLAEGVTAAVLFFRIYELTEERGAAFTDLAFGPDGSDIWCVRERWRDGEARRQIVTVPLDGSYAIRTLLTTSAFVSSLRPGFDGALLAWVAWDGPRMPWDGSELRVSRVTPDGLTDTHTVLGGEVESVFQPDWASADSLYVASDRSRWWNLYQVWPNGALRPLSP